MASRKASIHNSVQGFTLIEILVVMGILGVIAGFGLFVSIDTFRGYSFRSERDSIVSILQKTRSQAINNMCFGASCTAGKPHGVHIAQQGGVLTYTIFQGTAYVASDPLNEVIQSRYRAVTATGFTDIVFSPLAGTTTPNPVSTRSLLLADSAGPGRSTITVNSEGQIVWTN